MEGPQHECTVHRNCQKAPKGWHNPRPDVPNSFGVGGADHRPHRVTVDLYSILLSTWPASLLCDRSPPVAV